MKDRGCTSLKDIVLGSSIARRCRFTLVFAIFTKETSSAEFIFFLPSVRAWPFTVSILKPNRGRIKVHHINPAGATATRVLDGFDAKSLN